MDNLHPIEKWRDAKAASRVAEDPSAESLNLLTDALTRASQYQAETAELNRSLVQIKDSLAEAIIAFTSLAGSTLRTEARAQAAAEKLEGSVEAFGARQRDVLRSLDRETKRFMTLLVWTLILAAFAAAASFIGVLMPILTGR